MDQTPMQLDATDLALIASLSENARLSVSTLARRVGLARTTVQARVERLEKNGVIAGYALRLGEGARPALHATLLLKVEPKESTSIQSRLRTLPEVRSITTASGRYDLIAEISCDSPAILDRVLEAVTSASGILESESLIHLSTRLDRRNS
ncbi:MAG: AsnC family transcriptional regulator [Pseudomonadota bacterium]|nr:AsnC family transcriptional regulator [Pseudomonadota bacterium]